jgi:hypothetical protein
MSNALENNLHSQKLYTISEAARRLDVTYNRIKYAISNNWVKLYQREPDLIEESELMKFAEERNIVIPEL